MKNRERVGLISLTQTHRDFRAVALVAKPDKAKSPDPDIFIGTGLEAVAGLKSATETEPIISKKKLAVFKQIWS